MSDLEADLLRLQLEITDASLRELVSLLAQIAEHLGRMGEIVGMVRHHSDKISDDDLDVVLSANYNLRGTLESMVKDLTKTDG